MYSAGKLFSATGWKIGWGIGPKELIQPSTICKQFTGFSNASVGQIAIAKSLLNNSPYKGSDNYFKHVNEQCLKNAERMYSILSKIPGVRPLMPEGGYFILADITQAEFDRSLDYRLDYAFCKSIVKTKKVGAIPVSAFFSNYTPDNFVRFTVCKLQQSIDEFERKIL